ncbi:MAG: nicotinamide riboside transporter PnuC [Bacteroidales bacterium]|nr:nicotinamide riboside transporter PnuC [Bacteroidales bacterium]MCI2121228.1 nicotinamide riboside transporter PnuC [Bacteroidales bacterium]MCI2145982.1 nicotinamide riboside transporter PnuC [Bacteroidales bacterium]
MSGFDFWFQICTALICLAYVLLEVFHNKWMWVVWAFSSVACFVVFLKEHLYTNMLIQVYFFCAAIYGFIVWMKDEKKNGKPEGNEITVHPIQAGKAIASSAIAVVAFFLLAFAYTKFPAEVGNGSPLLDPLCASFSMLATYWLSQSWIEQWYIWIGVNAVSVWMYISTGMYPFAVLYFILFLTVFYGIWKWKKYGKIVKA